MPTGDGFIMLVDTKIATKVTLGTRTSAQTLILVPPTVLLMESLLVTGKAFME
jgi:hypothetical protein